MSDDGVIVHRRWGTLGPMGREFLINADFDISLRRTGTRTATAAASRQAAELPWQFSLLGRGGDSIRLDRPLDEDFGNYLSDRGIESPAVTVLPSIRPGSTFVPFGWNREASTINLRYDQPVDHPPLEVVRRVNGRRFSAGLEREIDDQSETLGVFSSVERLSESLAGCPMGETEWMVKSEHGNSGLGNRRLRSPSLSDSDRDVIARMVSENSCVVLERFRRRVLDLATVFEIGRDGSVGGLRIHEVVNTADGAFIGAIFDRDSESVARWGEEISSAVSVVARHLAAEGYFGPVCIDSFVWKGDGEPRLRPVVDINARHCMSAPGSLLWREWGREQVVYWRLFSARKLLLPASWAGLEKALGDDAFDHRDRRGVLLTSPLRIAGARPLRYGVVLAGEDRTEVDAMDRRLRGKFEE